MPGLWDDEAFAEGGLKSLKAFDGVLEEVEEDVEGKFGLQKAFHFINVTNEEAGDDYSNEDGTYTSWIKQSSRKGSLDYKVVQELKAFCAKNGLIGLPDCLYGVPMRWERKTYKFEGEGMSDGSAILPVRLLAKTAPAKSEPAKKKPAAKEADEPKSEVPAELKTAILEATKGDGATPAQIKAALIRKAATRKALKESGEIDSILASLVEEKSLEENEGVYFHPDL